MFSGVRTVVGLGEHMKRNEDSGQQRETASVVWTNRGKLLVYGYCRLTETVNRDLWVISVVCALDSKRSPPFFLEEEKFLYLTMKVDIEVDRLKRDFNNCMICTC